MERLIVRFPSTDLKVDVLQGYALDGTARMAIRPSFVQREIMTLSVNDRNRARLERLGAQVFEDVEFRVLPGPGGDDGRDDQQTWSGSSRTMDGQYTLADVVEQIRAPEAWHLTKGRGATIAILDTGIHAGLREIDPSRRSPIDLRTTYFGQHWNDNEGHGSMCAAIAAGSRRFGGRYDGVAPEATVIAARTTLRSTDLFEAYDDLVRLKAEGAIDGPLIVSNSYGLYVCNAPGVLPGDHPFIANVVAAVDAGIFVCFAAGNNHVDECGHDPASCGPNTIWGPNSHDRVVSVGTVNRDLSNRDSATPHVNSSRGPGEWATRFPKPDCVAPTYGEVPWGLDYPGLAWWGTSGACPQVAGLAALILSAAPHLAVDQVADTIRATCRAIPGEQTCVGAGLIDCVEGVNAALNMLAA